MLAANFARQAWQTRGILARNLSVATEELYDVVIVGGGLVGSSLACLLGSDKRLSSLRCLLLESSTAALPAVRPDSRFSNRVCSVSMGSVAMLREMGVWGDIQAVRVRPYSRMHIWDSDAGSCVEFSSTQHQEWTTPTDELTTPTDELTTPTDKLTTPTDEAIAYVIENDVMLQCVANKNETIPNLDVCRGVRLSGVTHVPEEECLAIKLENGRTVYSRLLVGADGVKSKVREMLQLDAVAWDYPQSGVVATLKVDSPGPNNTAWQRFLPSGPVALLPPRPQPRPLLQLNESSCSLVWSTSRDHAHRLVGGSDQEFVDQLNSALFDPVLPEPTASTSQAVNRWAGRLAGLPPSRRLPPTVCGVEHDSRRGFPLGFLHCSDYVAPRVALVGDSAHRVHPLAGLGVNLGFGDAQGLKDTIVSAVSRGADIGDLAVLGQYQRKRLQVNTPVVLGIDGLYRWFSSPWLPAVVTRGVGLQMVNALEPLKAFFRGRAEQN